MHVDEIVASAELPVDQVSSTLALMELKGLVPQVGSMNFVSVREESAAYYAARDESSN